MIVGITGYAGSGKDTVADYLVSKYGYERRGLADPIRQALYALNPIVTTFHFHTGRTWFGTLRERVDEIGWDAAKRESAETRRLLQVFGTEIGRNMFGSEFWLNQFDDWYDNRPVRTPVVVPDIRFRNEAEWLASDGILLRISRPGVERLNSHASEDGVPGDLIDHEIVNDGTIEGLHAMLDLLMESLNAPPS